MRVVSLADDRLPSLSSSLADLGAAVEVLLLGPEHRPARPLLAVIEARGKRYVDLPAASADRRSVVLRHLEEADVVLVTPSAADELGFRSVADLAAACPESVVAVVTDFGLTGPRATWTGTEQVFTALSGILSRSGEPGKPPLPPPGEIFLASAAYEIVWTVLGTVRQMLAGDRRRGVLLDCAIFEAGLVCLDPAYGMAGSGTPDIVDSEARPDAARIYPTFEARDGYVRVCTLARNQWLALREWMGDPAPLMAEEFLTNPGRWAHKDLIVPMQQEFFRDFTVAELVEECRRRRIPAAAVLAPADVLSEEHFRVTGALREIGTHDGKPVVAPAGMVWVDQQRLAATADTERSQPAAAWPDGGAGSGPHPLSGITVLDLGVIVAGAQAGLLFAQLGARVIRIENMNFPDGMRRSFESATPPQARGHRGKESVGLDLRSVEGRTIFLDLVRYADVVMSNFKPGTVERLGISYDDLRAVNPDIVCLESSAFGDTGPWRTAMGYGPLVRAATGLTWLCRESAQSDYFADGITIFPDHLVGRVSASAALACLLDRRRTGRGAHITVAQSDVALVAIAELIACESVSPGTALPPGDPADHPLGDLLFPAEGVDQWCVVDPRTPEQMTALREAIDAGPDVDLAEAVRAWVRSRPAREAAAVLQARGVPAGQMARHPDLPGDEALRARGIYESTVVPGTGEVIRVERPYARSADLVLPDLDPMPMFGAHTRAVLAEAGRSAAEIDDLLARGIAQESEGVRATFEESGKVHDVRGPLTPSPAEEASR